MLYYAYNCNQKNTMDVEMEQLIIDLKKAVKDLQTEVKFIKESLEKLNYQNGNLLSSGDFKLTLDAHENLLRMVGRKCSLSEWKEIALKNQCISYETKKELQEYLNSL
jgi:hypothetical protein